MPWLFDVLDPLSSCPVLVDYLLSKALVFIIRQFVFATSPLLDLPKLEFSNLSFPVLSSMIVEYLLYFFAILLCLFEGMFDPLLSPLLNYKKLFLIEIAFLGFSNSCVFPLVDGILPLLKFELELFQLESCFNIIKPVVSHEVFFVGSHPSRHASPVYGRAKAIRSDTTVDWQHRNDLVVFVSGLLRRTLCSN